MLVLLRLVAVDEHVGQLGVGEADDRVAPRDELGDHLVRDVEQPGEHVDREVGGDGVDEVDVLLREGGVDG